MTSISLHLKIEPWEEDDDDGEHFSGNRITGEVKRNEEILYTASIITNDSVESVCCFRDEIVDKIEDWAVKNTDIVLEPA